MPWCARKVLDTADIVRDAIFCQQPDCFRLAGNAAKCGLHRSPALLGIDVRGGHLAEDLSDERVATPSYLALRRAIFPIDPLNRISRSVSAHRFAEGREEGLFAEAREESKYRKSKISCSAERGIVAGRVGVACWKKQSERLARAKLWLFGVKRGQHAEGDVSPSRDYGG
jgi:hypothetical protein